MIPEGMTRQDSAEHSESNLADVAALALEDLLASDDRVLANSLRRLADDINRSAEAISGWSSYVDTTDQRV